MSAKKRARGQAPGGGGEPLPYAAPLPVDAAAGAGGREAPQRVRWAAYLMLLNSAFGLIGLVVALSTPVADYRATVARLDPTLTSEQIATAASTLLRYHTVEYAVILLANLALFFAIRRGRNWARVVTILLTGTELVLTLAGGFGAGGAAPVLLVSVVVDAAIIGLLATRQSRVYFGRARRRAAATQPTS